MPLNYFASFSQANAACAGPPLSQTVVWDRDCHAGVGPSGADAVALRWNWPASPDTYALKFWARSAACAGAPNASLTIAEGACFPLGDGNFKLTTPPGAAPPPLPRL